MIVSQVNSRTEVKQRIFLSETRLVESGDVKRIS